MGHFTIDLPLGGQAEVRYGRIIEKTRNFRDLFGGRSSNRVKRIGYIVKVDPVQGARREYRFLRSIEGVWIKEENEGFGATEDDELSIEIKNRIDEYEKRHY